MISLVTVGIYEEQDDEDGSWARVREKEVRAGSVSYFEPLIADLFRAQMLDGSSFVTDAAGKATVVETAAAEH